MATTVVMAATAIAVVVHQQQIVRVATIILV
jgi:hypothetical protein